MLCGRDEFKTRKTDYFVGNFRYNNSLVAVLGVFFVMELLDLMSGGGKNSVLKKMRLNL
jgi:hypothetical protein